MLLYPSVDILDGKAVRLLHGNREKVTVYGDPAEVVRRYVSAGASIVHVVDLNGAFDGDNRNDEVLKEVAKLPITKQLGGGIRSEKRAEEVFRLGFDKVVLGSACVTDLPLVKKLCLQYGNRIVGCLDTKDGKVAIKGWTEKSAVTPTEQALILKDLGVTDVVFTDISRDGAMVGVNAELTAKLQRDSGLNVIASGGVKDQADIDRLTGLGVYGAILGKALYLGSINLREAIEKCIRNG